MSLYNYVDTPNSNLICCICRAPFTDPITTRTCAHTFCSECILRALSHSAQCPVDRSPLALGDLAPASPIVRSLVDELQVECIHRQEGCLHICQRQSLPVHLRDYCDFGELECVEDCGELIKRRDLGKHLEHVHGRADKSHDTQEDSKQASSSSSDEKTYTCPHSSVGCPYNGPLKPADHLASCPYESLKDFFSINNARMASLTEQNILLRHRVEALETTNHQMRKESMAVSTVLGPWYRVACSGISGRLPGTSSLAHRAGVVSSGGVTGTTSNQDAALSTPGPLSTEDAQDAFASYFPTEEQSTSRPAIGGLGHRSTASMPVNNAGQELSATTPGLTGQATTPPTHPFYARSGGFMGNPATSACSTSTASLIAPLDTSSGSVERTLVSLRESILNLAQGVDSIGRRGEIALANETLRLGEEMMSVRGQMHGLRMQVHGMLMELNGATMRGMPGQSGEDGVQPWAGAPFPHMMPPPHMSFMPLPSATQRPPGMFGAGQSITKL